MIIFIMINFYITKIFFNLKFNLIKIKNQLINLLINKIFYKYIKYEP
jgi:hypothetical protein